MNSTTEISLTRKLRELIGLQEISLTEEEAELFDIESIDQYEPDFLTIETEEYHEQV